VRVSLPFEFPLAPAAIRQMRSPPALRRHVHAPERALDAFYVSGLDDEEREPDLVREMATTIGTSRIGSHGYFHEGVDPGELAERAVWSGSHQRSRDHRHRAEGMALAGRTQDRSHAAQAPRG